MQKCLHKALHISIRNFSKFYAYACKFVCKYAEFFWKLLSVSWYIIQNYSFTEWKTDAFMNQTTTAGLFNILKSFKFKIYSVLYSNLHPTADLCGNPIAEFTAQYSTKYSKGSNTESIRKPNVLVFSFRMVRFLNGRFDSNCSDFEWS